MNLTNRRLRSLDRELLLLGDHDLTTCQSAGSWQPTITLVHGRQHSVSFVNTGNTPYLVLESLLDQQLI